MKKIKLDIGNVLLILFLVLLAIPQTRKPIQVVISKARMLVFSPSITKSEKQIQLPQFEYLLTQNNGTSTAISIGNGRVSFISYWATWCPPCIAELPSIQKLYKDYGDEIDFILLTNEKPATVYLFLEKKGFDLPVYFPKMKAPEALYSTSIPTNYIIDATGKIIIKETGAVNWNSTKTRELLDGLLLK